MGLLPASTDERLRLFDALVAPHLDRLLGFARRRTTTSVDAEDAVQEALVRAWEGFAGLRELDSLRAWLYRILRTVLSEQQRTARRRLLLVPTTPLEDVAKELLARESEGALEALVAGLSSQDLHAALARIPEDYALAVELHDMEGLKYREIAEALALPLGTVMSRISRGRQALACELARHADRAPAEALPAKGRAREGREP